MCTRAAEPLVYMPFCCMKTLGLCQEETASFDAQQTLVLHEAELTRQGAAVGPEKFSHGRNGQFDEDGAVFAAGLAVQEDADAVAQLFLAQDADFVVLIDILVGKAMDEIHRQMVLKARERFLFLMHGREIDEQDEAVLQGFELDGAVRRLDAAESFAIELACVKAVDADFGIILVDEGAFDAA